MPDPTHLTLHVFVRDAKRQLFCDGLSGNLSEASIRYTTTPGGACRVWDLAVTPNGNGVWWCASWRCATARAQEILASVGGCEAWYVAYDDEGTLQSDNLQPYSVPVPSGPTMADAATALGLTRQFGDPS